MSDKISMPMLAQPTIWRPKRRRANPRANLQAGAPAYGGKLGFSDGGLPTRWRKTQRELSCVRVHYMPMGNPRIIVTCPVTSVAVITNIAYAEIIEPRKTPRLFRCPCGEMHKLRFVGKHGNLRQEQMRERQTAS